jgi:RIO kinase 1
MQFIGTDTTAAPTLKALKLKSNRIFENVLLNMKKLYGADLVHGDLSEYNILMEDGKPFLIDLSQAVPLNHPLAEELLTRDVKNICRYFGKKFDKVYDSIVN